jgi:hypothetical protein
MPTGRKERKERRRGRGSDAAAAMRGTRCASAARRKRVSRFSILGLITLPSRAALHHTHPPARPPARPFRRDVFDVARSSARNPGHRYRRRNRAAKGVRDSIGGARGREYGKKEFNLRRQSGVAWRGVAWRGVAWRGGGGGWKWGVVVGVRTTI